MTKITRLYSLFGKLSEDHEDTVLMADVLKGDAVDAFRQKRDYMKWLGFRVRERRDDVDGLPSCEVENPLTGKAEAYYWLRETDERR